MHILKRQPSLGLIFPGCVCFCCGKHLASKRSELEEFEEKLQAQLATHAQARRAITKKEKNITKLTRELEKLVRSLNWKFAGHVDEY